MFGSFGFDEMMLVALVAVVIFGRDLPRVARQVGRYYGKLKRQFTDVRDEINSALDAEEAKLTAPPEVKPPEERQVNRDDIEDPTPPDPQLALSEGSEAPRVEGAEAKPPE